MRPTPMLDAVAIAGARNALIADANERYAKYPQYLGHFDRWGLYVVTHYVAFKGSSVLVEGQIVLADTELSVEDGLPVTRSTYCTETGSVVAMPHEYIRAVHCTEDYGHDSTLTDSGCRS